MFKVIAGQGKHGMPHEQRFFELAGEMAALVEFIDDDDAAKLLEIVQEDGAPLSWARFPVEFGIVEHR